MAVHHTLMCFFFLSLLDGVSGQIFVYAAEGGDVEVTVSFIQSGNTKFFCKEECKEEDVLIETTKDTAQSGRYTIKYSETHRGEYLVSVTITNVTKSDSGGYRSGFKHRTYSLYHEFKINVEDGGSLHVEIKQLNELDSGWYSCGMVRPLSHESYRRFKILVSNTFTDPATVRWKSIPTTSTPPARPSQSPALTNMLLYLVGILVIVVIILGLVLTIICIQRKRKPDCSRTAGNSGGTNMEIAQYENYSPDSPCEESPYEILDPAGMDQNQTYSTLTEQD
ncbi:uncharacterized protein LOC115584975 isoform X2 [Sparus aurata]|uniref:uncharacterized protein LOC115584975 isoform X2 n=1 Tax=Sparus aurata TaxID=8175 RepID=UPI0011C1A831|nr:uncharacterized protein LOC115584975 isoform X2 [Sparus aurata]